jgi:glycolate oxidase iron-sulfur subunit
MTPEIQRQFSAELITPVTPAIGKKRVRVAMLMGCAQDPIFSDVNRDTVEVLARNGCEVVTPPEQSCCGSLHAHNGEWRLAQELARRNIDEFPPEQFDAIITNAGGCGSHLKHFSKFLEGDSKYQERAALWDKKVKDISEWLVEIGYQVPGTECQVRGVRCQVNAPRNPPALPDTPHLTPDTLIVTYHDSCHLCHGQKITAQPRELLRGIPGLKLVDLPESSWCCGSAGIYNITQPEMAGELVRRKLRHIKSTGAQVVATANPGCLLQIINGAQAEGLKLRVAHPITLLAEAYRR